MFLEDVNWNVVEQLNPTYKYKAKLIHFAVMQDPTIQANLYDILIRVHDFYIKIKNDKGTEFAKEKDHLISKVTVSKDIEDFRFPGSIIIMPEKDRAPKLNPIDYYIVNKELKIYQNTSDILETNYFTITKTSVTTGDLIVHIEDLEKVNHLEAIKEFNSYFLTQRTIGDDEFQQMAFNRELERFYKTAFNNELDK